MLSAGRILIARLDNLGDVILSGPAVRAAAGSGAEIVYLCSPQGRPAALTLPGVSRVVTVRAPWIDAHPRRVTRRGVEQLVDALAGTGADAAIILTSFHQSALPLALLMRMAGIDQVAAISEDYPGSLLDVRHTVPDDIHEVERSLSLMEAAGFGAAKGDDRRLRINVAPADRDRSGPDGSVPAPYVPAPYVVVHAGASVPARAWSPELNARLVRELVRAGHQVVLTGGREEVALTDRIARAAGNPASVINLAGQTAFPVLAAVIGGASCIVCGNTGPAHIAAAMGTPVVSIYAPTVPAVRWRPWMTPHVLLGRQDISCAGCRARTCPVRGHPCVSDIPVSAAVEAVQSLTALDQAVAS